MYIWKTENVCKLHTSISYLFREEVFSVTDICRATSDSTVYVQMNAWIFSHHVWTHLFRVFWWWFGKREMHC